MKPLPLLVVAGPTASGKTALAVALAERLDTEIISADSMQVYRGMALGTGAPSADELARVRHHFIGCLDPSEQFSAGAFGAAGRAVVERLWAEGRTPVVAGGSGLYVRALTDGLFEGPARVASVRTRLHREAEGCGLATLYERLQAVDPDYAARISPGDARRIVRALEVAETTGKPFSQLHKEAEVPPLPAVYVGLDYPRAELYARIDRRVAEMVASGFAEEVRALVDAGHGDRLRTLRALGYREFMDYLAGARSLDEAQAAMQQVTRRFAKRQLSWWRGDARMHWIPTRDGVPPEQHVDAVLRIYAEAADAFTSGASSSP